MAGRPRRNGKRRSHKQARQNPEWLRSYRPDLLDPDLVAASEEAIRIAEYLQDTCASTWNWSIELAWDVIEGRLTLEEAENLALWEGSRGRDGKQGPRRTGLIVKPQDWDRDW
jgi:hypothetical protein